MVAAAAAQALAAGRGQPSQQQDLQAQLLAAAASLPLQGLNYLCSTARAAEAAAPDTRYAEAAALFSRYGVLSLSPWSSQHTGKPMQAAGSGSGMMPNRPFATHGAPQVLEMYTRNSSSVQHEPTVTALQGAFAAAQRAQSSGGTAAMEGPQPQRGRAH